LDEDVEPTARSDWTRRRFAHGATVARLAPGDLHHPPDPKSRVRPAVVEG